MPIEDGTMRYFYLTVYFLIFCSFAILWLNLLNNGHIDAPSYLVHQFLGIDWCIVGIKGEMGLLPLFY